MYASCKDHQNFRIGSSSGRRYVQNTINSFARYYLEGEPSMMLKEIAVLHCSSESEPFSDPGNSGSGIVNGKGRLVGSLMGGTGASDTLDSTYVSSVSFLCTHMLMYGLKANFFPSAA